MGGWPSAAAFSPVEGLPAFRIPPFLGPFAEPRRDLPSCPPTVPPFPLQSPASPHSPTGSDPGWFAPTACRAATEMTAPRNDGRDDDVVIIATAEGRAGFAPENWAGFDPWPAFLTVSVARARRSFGPTPWAPRASLFFGVGLVGGMAAALLASLL